MATEQFMINLSKTIESDATLAGGTVGTVTIGVTQYPAVKDRSNVIHRSTKPSGEGKWVVVRSPKNAETFVPLEQPKPAKVKKAKKAENKGAENPLGKLVRQGEGDAVKFYRIRGNGTRRHVPVLAGTELAQARVIQDNRRTMTVRQIAEALHMSPSSVRRVLISLALTEAVLAETAKEA